MSWFSNIASTGTGPVGSIVGDLLNVLVFKHCFHRRGAGGERVLLDLVLFSYLPVTNPSGFGSSCRSGGGRSCRRRPRF